MGQTDRPVEGQIALVTGASRGIGKAIAETLAAAGAKVIGTATSDNGAEKISEYLAASGGKGMCLKVTDDASIKQVLKDITADFGAISELVNNAGITCYNVSYALHTYSCRMCATPVFDRFKSRYQEG